MKIQLSPQKRNALLAIMGLTAIGFLFTNAISTGPAFDMKSLSCVGLSSKGMAIGVKAESEILKDCSRTSGLSIQTRLELSNLKGADVFDARIDVKGLVRLGLLSSNFYRLDADGVRFENATTKRSSFLDPHLKSVEFMGGTMDEVSFSGSSSDARPLQDVSFLNLKFLKSKFENLTVADGQFRNVVYQGHFTNLQASKFTSHDSTFNEVLFSDVDFANSRFFGTQIEKSRVCGSLKFDSSYFSRSKIAIEGQPKSVCVKESLVSFNSADLKYSEVSVSPGTGEMLIDFSNAELQGADLSGLDTRNGKWAFKGAKVDQHTKLPKNFSFKAQLVFTKSKVEVK